MRRHGDERRRQFRRPHVIARYATTGHDCSIELRKQNNEDKNERNIIMVMVTVVMTRMMTLMVPTSRNDGCVLELWQQVGRRY
jgi:hypothetical protein